jgi:hypothetical protein
MRNKFVLVEFLYRHLRRLGFFTLNLFRRQLILLLLIIIFIL